MLSPKVMSYEFKSRNEVAKATRFQCILVSQDPKQFMIGSVPFSFAAKDAASNAKDKIQDGLTLEIKSPQFDTKMKADFVRCPLKRVANLSPPTVEKNTSRPRTRLATGIRRSTLK